MLAALLLATVPFQSKADSTRRDTVRLQPIEVTVTRMAESRRRFPGAIGFLDSTDLRRGRLLTGIDEALGGLPGLTIANRYNPSLDQRLVMRGAGSRANFGVRGVKILIDGLPQTLPDGQSQLSNLDLGVISQVEVLSGSASALYGNAAGGVVGFTTEMPNAPAFARLRASGGAFGSTRASLTVGGLRGTASGLAAFTRYDADGFRQHSRTRSTQATVAGNLALGSTWLAKARYFGTVSPRAENPGALTAAELALERDSAAAANILRGADKSVTQHQLGLTLSRHGSRGSTIEVTVFGLLRDLENPLAVAPPGPPSSTAGTYSAIDRIAGGFRLQGAEPLGRLGGRLGFGFDAQVMRDLRENRRSRAGVATDTVLVDQRELVSELGPFASLSIEITPTILATAAARYDRLRFTVTDRHLADGEDQSGSRTLGAASGSLGVSYTAGPVTGWAAVSSAFETPTTTELANQPGGAAGFNETLDPQRATNVELGARWEWTASATLSAVAYRTSVRSAIVQAREVNGRAYFENAGRIRHRGVELGVNATVSRWLSGRIAYTYTDSRFVEYRLRDGTTVDTLDGNRVPGIPAHVARTQLVFGTARFSLEVEQQIVSDQVADDRNAITVDGWGAGIANARVSGRVPLARIDLAPFAGVHNVFDRRYVGSVNVNGFGGRVFEPAPGRWAFVGLELGWRRGSEQ